MAQSDQRARNAAARLSSPESGALRERFRAVRAASEALTRSLTPEDQLAQSMPDASPAKWHLAHTSWFFETFLLAPRLAGYRPLDARFGYLFNSYYEAVGARQPRPQRGLLTRPSLADVRADRAHVDAGMARLLQGGAAEAEPLVALGLAHEEQHQELILMDILHLFAQSPLKPAYGPGFAPSTRNDAVSWVEFAGGRVEIGAKEECFGFDNEFPAHETILRPF